MEHIRRDLEFMLEQLKLERHYNIQELSDLLKRINKSEQRILDAGNKIEELEKLLSKQEE
jgi:hypothetical protein